MPPFRTSHERGGEKSVEALRVRSRSGIPRMACNSQRECVLEGRDGPGAGEE